MIKGKNIVAAILCAVLLTGCGKKAPDLTKIYKDTFDYTLGEYSIGEQIIDDNGYTEWCIIFTDKSGNERKAYLYSEVYDDVQKKYFDNKTDLRKYDLFEFYRSAFMHIGSSEIWNNIILEHFDVEYDPDSFLMKNDEVSVTAMALPAISLSTSEKAREIAENMISSENGIRLCEEDLSSIAARDYMMFAFAVTVHEGVDPEPYIKKTEAVLAEFEKYSPQNYQFMVKNSEKEVCFSKYKVLGSEIDKSELVDDDGNSIRLKEAVANAIGINDEE